MSGVIKRESSPNLHSKPKQTATAVMAQQKFSTMIGT